MSNKNICYSEKYQDDQFEYRHVHLPKDLAQKVPKGRLMSEQEWRSLGIQQSQGWVHYLIHNPEHVLITATSSNNGRRNLLNNHQLK